MNQNLLNNEEKIEFIKNNIGKFQNFPKEGIEFKDIFTALTNGKVCIYLKELILSHIKTACPDIDAVVGLDSRGFLFSFLIAAELGISCVPIRKKGKLPGLVESVEYVLEYGTDIFEIQRSSIKPGQRVLIIDDLLATGGSMAAAVELVQKVGGIVVEAYVVLELAFLEGRKRLDCNVHSLIKYNS